MPVPTGQYGTLEWFQQEYKKVSKDPWGLTWRPSQLLRYQRVLQTLGRIEQPVTSCLDVGCATGEFTGLLSKRLSNLTRLVGVDFVDSAIERAKSRFPRLAFAKESVFSVGQTYEAQFDVVACLEVLYYVEVERRKAALHSVRRTLKAGGYAVFSSLIAPPPHFSPDEFLGLVGSEFEIVQSEILHLRLVSLLEKVGSKAEKLMTAMARNKTDAGIFHRLSSLPLPAVVAVEKWSRHLGAYSASHTVILARAPQ